MKKFAFPLVSFASTRKAILVLILIAFLPMPAPAQINGGVASHPPIADAALGQVAYRYLRNHGWWPAHVLGTVEATSSDQYAGSKTLVVIEWGISPNTLRRRYYDGGSFALLGAGEMWSLVLPGIPSVLWNIRILDPWGDVVDLTEVHPPAQIP